MTLLRMIRRRRRRALEVVEEEDAEDTLQQPSTLVNLSVPAPHKGGTLRTSLASSIPGRKAVLGKPTMNVSRLRFQSAWKYGGNAAYDQ